VADARESPSIDVLSLLLERGARATYHDPYLQTLTLPDRSRDSGAPSPPPGVAHAHNGAPPGAPPPGGTLHSWEEEGLHLRSVDLIPALEGADCVVICTDHSAYDWEDVVARARLLVDTRNALRHVRAARAEVVRL
ncbi:MAG TPA: UDP binding domain-containing protein, partial [Chloroflexota bacterium]|nr:UDP binding domain-containing protein [Chloroflexota bacterium]